MVIYFTGTGNSEYLAKIIATELNDELVDTTKLIRDDKHPTFSSSKPYIVVTPTYAWRMPRLLERWMEKCKFEGNKKVYFVLNCGSEIGAAAKYIEKFSKKMGFEYMGTAEVVMPENYIIMFNAPSDEECVRTISKAKKYVLKLTCDIKNGMNFEKVRITLLGRLYSGIVNFGFNTFYIGSKKFYSTDSCISCGKCEKECMLNNIAIKDGRPVWGKDCTHCMACICKCPVSAIEYGKNTKDKKRYVFSKEG